MIPIYEQGYGRGIGHSVASFLERFDTICRDHLDNKRAKAFSFIFYDFNDKDLRRILKEQGVFTKLDRLSGTDLSLFYLHTGRRRTVTRFNTAFLAKLGIQENATLPCVVFFKFHGDHIAQVAAVPLDSTNLVHGFQELYGIIEEYISSDLSESPDKLRVLKWLKSAGGFLSVEIFRTALRKMLELLIRPM